MIIQCEKCQAKFKIADSKLKPGGIKVRCSKCKNVFRVSPGEDGAAQPTPPAESAAAPPPAEAEPPAAAAPPASEPAAEEPAAPTSSYVEDSAAEFFTEADTGSHEFSLEELIDDLEAGAKQARAETISPPPSEPPAQSSAAEPPAATQSAPGKAAPPAAESPPPPAEPASPFAPLEDDDADSGLSLDLTPPPAAPPAAPEPGKKPPAIRKLQGERSAQEGTGEQLADYALPAPTNRLIKIVMPLLMLLLLPPLLIWVYLTTLGLPFGWQVFRYSIDGQIAWRGETPLLYQLASDVKWQSDGGQFVGISGSAYNPNPSELSNLLFSFRLLDDKGELLDLVKFPCCSNLNGAIDPAASRLGPLEEKDLRYLIPLRSTQIERIQLEILDPNGS